MSFCPNALPVVKNILAQITDFLVKAVAEITAITAGIKALELNPTVEALIALIPNGSTYEGYFNTALNVLNGTANTAESFIENLQAWINTYATPAELNRGLLALASETVKAADVANQVTTGVSAIAPKKDSFYDYVVLSHILGIK